MRTCGNGVVTEAGSHHGDQCCRLAARNSRGATRLGLALGTVWSQARAVLAQEAALKRRKMSHPC